MEISNKNTNTNESPSTGDYFDCLMYSNFLTRELASCNNNATMVIRGCVLKAILAVFRVSTEDNWFGLGFKDKVARAI